MPFKTIVCFLLLAAGAWQSSPSLTHVPLQDPYHAVEEPSESSLTEAAFAFTANETIRHKISRGEIQTFPINLSSGQYAEAVFEWFGISLNVSIIDPVGSDVFPSDIQVTTAGPVAISIIATQTGTYKVKVTTPVKQKVSGQYGLTFIEAKTPTEADHARLKAQAKIVEAQKSRDSPTKIALYNSALALSLEAGDDNAGARINLLLGDAYRAANDFGNAQVSYEQAETIWYKTNYARGQGYALIRLGLLHRSTSPKEALPYYQQAQLVFANIEDRIGQADALYGSAFALMLLHLTPEAIEVLQRTLDLRHEEQDRMGEANALNMMADAYRTLGDYDKALEMYNEATRAARDLEYRFLEASLINGKGVIYDDQGYWQDANVQYDESIKAHEDLLTQPLMTTCVANPSPEDATVCRSAVRVLLNFGETYNSMGEPLRAELEFEKALRISSVLGPSLSEGSANFHLGYSEFLLENPSKALEYYEKALALQKTNDAESALTYTYMGMVFTARGDHASALKYYSAAQRIQQNKENTPVDKRTLAIILDKLATGYGFTGNFSAATENYLNALELWRAVKDPDGEALTLHHMAMAQQLSGNLAEAEQYSDGALKLVESLRTRIKGQRFRASYLASRDDYYKLNIDLKMQRAKFSANADYYAAALESNEKERARVFLDSLNDATVGRADSNANPDPPLAKLIEQKRNLLEMIEAKSFARSNLLSREHTPEQISFLDDEMRVLNDRYDQLQIQIRARNPRFARLTEPQPIGLSDIQKQLDENTVLLEYSLGEPRSYVWVVGSHSIVGFELSGRTQIETAAQQLSKFSAARNQREPANSYVDRVARADADYIKSATALSKLAIEPLGDLLANKRLIVVADGELQRVSFAALPTPASLQSLAPPSPRRPPHSKSDAPTLLVEAHEIVYEPSGSVFALQRRELANRASAPYAIAVLADPVYDKDDERIGESTAHASNPRQRPLDSKAAQPKAADTTRTANSLTRALDDLGVTRFPALHYSKNEAQAVIKAAGQSRSMVALNFDASRATALNPDLAKYRIVHFSTHAIADFAHPELSGIVLSLVNEKGQPQDGYLRLHDIYNLNLPADLVVLSACQTGVGKEIKGEGLIALTRGFMYAGAQRVVASLWKVDDAATAELMAEFYDQMFTRKLSPAAALRAAQMKLAHQPGRREPYYWAGFVLQGEWR